MTGAVLAGKLVSPRQLLGVCLQSEGRYEHVTLIMNSAKIVMTEGGPALSPTVPSLAQGPCRGWRGRTTAQAAGRCTRFPEGGG